jgi:hypothetical protein
VLIECYKAGILLRGLLHDWSKFLPSEWFPYVDYFYDEMGVNYKKTEVDDFRYWTNETHYRINQRFDLAWLKHQHRNPHHWQYWLLRRDSGDLVAIEMPYEFILEMICDWKGAGRAMGKTATNECRSWYVANKTKMHMHEETRRIVEVLLEVP